MITELIRQKLTAELNPQLIEIIDNSAAHAGHAGTRQGGGHYHLTIVAEVFNGKSLIQRHQLIYTALSEMMKDQIHALGINALTPSEHSTGAINE
jgi:BolA protein